MEKQDKERFKKAYKLAIKHYFNYMKVRPLNRVLSFLLPAVGTIFVFYIPPVAIAKIVSIANSDVNPDFTKFIPYVIAFGVSWLIGELLWRLGIFFDIRSHDKALRQIQSAGLGQVLKHDVKFFHDNFAGSLTKKTTGYSARFVDVNDVFMLNVFPNIIPGIFALIVLTFYSPLLSICLAGWIILTLIIVIPMIKKRYRLVTLRETASNIVSGHIADVYGNIDAVRAHGSENFEKNKHRLLLNDFVNKIIRSWKYQNNVIDIAISPLYVLTNVTGLILGLYLASIGSIEYSSIIVVFTYYALVTRVMWEFNGIYRRLESSLSDAAQYTELLLDEPSIKDPIEPQRVISPKGEIVFNNVGFAYENNEDELFTEFNLKINPGEKVGLIGRSGGGKTSITKLILRFSDVDSGTIEIDGVPVNKMTQKHLRSMIAYVPQDPVMFHRSIADNISYGRISASEQEVIAAAKKAHADEFINDLPKGYKTLVGERGIKLSGGQRQRVAIARAILRDAPILLLDEATSALDSESEGLIQDALKKLMRDRTAIVIAHRLSTIQNMDRIVVLEKGKIIEEGSHKELLSQNGTYAKLWTHQSGGFLED